VTDLAVVQSTDRSPNLRPAWGKGVSGNPGGKPKSFGALIREQTGDGAELVAIALEIVRARRKPVKYRLQALEWLADRGWGKVVQSHELGGGVGSITIREIVVERWTDAGDDA